MGLKSSHFGLGHLNHSLFWQSLLPKNEGGGEFMNGPLADAIKSHWGNFENFKSKFNAELAGIQGSGWGWLVKEKDTNRLSIITTAVHSISYRMFC
jgi:Fe-Mn family superoxide dismutase